VWPTYRLDEIAQIVAGGKSGLSGKHFVDSGFPAYGAGGLNGLLPTWEHEDGAVILSSIGARCGKCFIPSGKWSSLANTQLIFPNPERADRRFLWYLLDDESRWHRSGSAQPYIKPSDVKSHRVALPPLPEQRRIASILDAAQGVHDSRLLATRMLGELRASVLEAAFSGSRLVKLGESIAFLTSGSRGWAKYYSAAGSPFLRIQNVKSDALDLGDLARVNPPSSRESERTRVQVGDVLLSITADLGRTAVVDERAAGGHVSQHLAIVRISGLNPRVVSAYLSSPSGRAQMMKLNRGATKQGLNFDDIRSLKVPSLDAGAAKELEERVSAIDLLVDQHSRHMRSITDAKMQFASRAFRGEL